MSTTPVLAIVGASLAGAKAAEAARDSGYEGRIVLVGDKAGLPYERPPLSKAVLRGEADIDTVSVHADGYYAAHDIELVTDHVTALDAMARASSSPAGTAWPSTPPSSPPALRPAASPYPAPT